VKKNPIQVCKRVVDVPHGTSGPRAVNTDTSINSHKIRIILSLQVYTIDSFALTKNEIESWTAGKHSGRENTQRRCSYGIDLNRINYLAVLWCNVGLDLNACLTCGNLLIVGLLKVCLR